jgi:hypothetical protein
MSLKTVSVTFVANGQYGQNAKQYEYLTEYNVSKGDIAIVDSPQDGFVTVKIQSVNEGAVGKATKFLVQVVDDTEYLKQVERRQKRTDIIKRLESKKKQVEEMAVWNWLAENDSEAAKLLEELKTI